MKQIIHFQLIVSLSLVELPSFLRVDLPALNFELKQKYFENDEISSSHRILSFSIPKQSLNNDHQDVSFSVNIIESDRRGITEALSSIRDKHLTP